MATFEDLMNGFGVVTVMNACIYELDGSYANRVNCCQIGQNDGAFTPKMWKKTGEIIDTLKIANISYILLKFAKIKKTTFAIIYNKNKPPEKATVNLQKQ